MRLMRVGPVGAERPAVWRAPDLALDVSGVVSDFDPTFLEGDGLQRLDDVLATAPVDLPEIDLTMTRIGAPLSRPGKVVCIGLNYREHAVETGMALPPEPIVFLKTASTVVGPNDDVLIPPGSEKTDYEVELAVVIGRTARYLPDTAVALDHVAGFAISNDVSERAYQFERGGQWDKGKNCETFNPFGPWITTSDEIEDPQSLSLGLSVNGDTRQSSSTADMVFDVSHLIWYLSQFMVLEPGDIINTGTPPGVGSGMEPPTFLGSGDVVEVSIAQLGQQRQIFRSAEVRA